MKTAPKYGLLKSEDNTGRVITYDLQTPAYATPLEITSKNYDTLIIPLLLTGVITLNATVTGGSSKGDVITFIFTSDATGRTVTFGTNFVVTAATLALTASKQGTIVFKSDGIKWIEISRTVLI